jgi:hypothetical protein
VVADFTPSRNKIPFSVRKSRPAIERFLATLPYYPCLLLVSPEIQVLSAAQSYFLAHYEWKVLSIGHVLSRELRSVAPAKRPRRVRDVLQTTVQARGSGPLLCTEVDLLFHPSLQQNPLRLLREASRRETLIVLWPGTYENDTLAYAVEEHGHYRTFANPDLCSYCIIGL